MPGYRRTMLFYFMKLSEKRQRTLIEIAKDMLHADMIFQEGRHPLSKLIERDHGDESGHIYKEEPGR